jgi:hypothetical protein
MLGDNFTDDERQAVLQAVNGSIDLYSGYIKLRPESPQMARKQGLKRRQLALLKSAQPKLRTKRGDRTNAYR